MVKVMKGKKKDSCSVIRSKRARKEAVKGREKRQEDARKQERGSKRSEKGKYVGKQERGSKGSEKGQYVGQQERGSKGSGKETGRRQETGMRQ